MPIPARPRLEGPAETFSVPAPGGGGAVGGSAASVLSLQRSAGNAAVAGLLQRNTMVHDRASHVTGVELEVGADISLELAAQAKAVAAGGVTDAELRTLRKEALGDETINDNERMFLAALLDAGNARKVAAATVAAGTTFTFDRTTIEPHLAHARDLDQAVKDPAIGAERAKAAAAPHWVERVGHDHQAVTAIFAQVVALTGAAWKDKALDAFGFAIGKIPIDDVLEAMIAAASDDTPGDRAMAAVVYVVAATAGHPMAPMVRSGKIQVDQVKTLTGGEFASYRTTAGGDGGKGDTITVPSALDVADVAHRSVVIHELTHAEQDTRATGPTVQMTDREQSEIEAYRAGARYQLEQAADLGFIPRMQATRKIAGLLNEISMLALVLESRADPARFVPVVREVNAFWIPPLDDATLDAALRAHETKVSRLMQISIGKAYGIRDPSGTPIPGANDLPVDALKGENIFDWIDRV